MAQVNRKLALPWGVWDNGPWNHTFLPLWIHDLTGNISGVCPECGKTI